MRYLIFLLYFLSIIREGHSELSILFKKGNIQIDAEMTNRLIQGSASDTIKTITTIPTTAPVDIYVTFINNKNFCSSDHLSLKIISVNPKTSDQNPSKINLWDGSNTAADILLIHNGEGKTVEYEIIFEYVCSALNRSCECLSGIIQLTATASTEEFEIINTPPSKKPPKDKKDKKDKKS